MNNRADAVARASKVRHLDPSPSSRRPLIAAVLLGLLSFAVFLPALDCGFVGYDDDDYVKLNPHVQNGLSLDEVQWACTATDCCNWHPLTWLSLMADRTIYGPSPLGFHLTNLLLHTANTILLFYLLLQLTGGFWQSAIAAAIFAVHPLRVESVVWVAERKDVLSSFFGFLALWQYGRYVKTLSSRRYLLTLAFFALSLLSKPMLMTLPFLLLLLDWWPFRRLRLEWTGTATRATASRATSGDAKPRSLPYLLVEKLPFFGLTITSCIVTFIAERSGGAVSTLENVGAGSRAANVITAYVRYLENMFCVTDLTVFYPLRRFVPASSVVGCAIVLAILTMAAFACRRNAPWITMGWLWFVGLMVPVIGIIPLGSQWMADRWTYIPEIGLLLLIWSFPAAWFSSAARRYAVGALTAGLLVTCCLFTWRQIQFWRDGVSLFQRAVAINPDSEALHTYLGILLSHQGRYQEALDQCQAALRIDPNFARAHTTLAAIDNAQNRPAQALEECRLALVAPNPAYLHETYNNLGIACAKLGKYDDAMGDFRKALEFKPHYQAALRNYERAEAMRARASAR